MMELLYIWVDNYKNIKKQGFNFNPKYRFDYNNSEKELTVTKNPNHIPNFFPENISNVTAIVGENGAGKTNLLEIIWELDKEISGIKNFIIVYSDSIYSDLDIKIIDKTDNNWEEKKKIIQKKKEIIEKDLIQKIFYSNNFDAFSSNMDSLDISNIQKLIYGSQAQNQGMRKTLDYHIVYPTYKNKDFVRMLNFMSDLGKMNKNILVKNPKYMTISLDFSPINHLKEHKKYDSDNHKGFVKTLIEFIASILLSLSMNSNGSKDKSNEIEEYNNIFKEYPTKETLKEYYQIVSVKPQNAIKLLWDYYKVNDYIEMVISEIENFIQNNLITEGYLSLTIDVDDKDNIKFISRVIETGFLVSFFSYGFKNVDKKTIYYSSGELNLWNIYGRFYQVLQEEKIADVDKILVLIDEGENTLHPDWQKKFIKLLIDVLPKIFEGKQLQIILTSHSPFLVSDLPNENIVFLEKDEKTGKCIVKNSLNDMKHTFGANIHTLLTDSFFMKGGLMGDFAKKKINEVIDDLISRDAVSEKRQKEIRNIINAVGDDIIKRKLMQMFQDKFNLDIDARISRLEQEINNLKQQKNNDTNTE